ncbi:MAG: ornithine carbamoyltransferase [Lachnospiraceae bacterium]|nr:ornithine carbamoyltransferase [Lachnospiraceae bacterium]MBR1568483.1 ornithine carbamoyltransferase [Lachnospiraceae bacterium]
MKNMLNFKEYSKEELMAILNLALDMKKDPAKYSKILEGKKLYTLFEKTSTRTFLSFTTGMTELGGTYYNQLWKDSNFVLGEPVSELRYVGRNVDIIMARLIKNETVELFGEQTTVPFINGCDSTYHPCQILADALTLLEKFGTLNVKFLYIGAKNNVFNSLVEFFAKMECGTLYGLTPLVNDTAVESDFYEKGKASGYYVELDPTMSMEEAKKYVKDMDVLYTDTWVDMEFFNNPDYAEKKKKTLKMMMPYQINKELLEGSKAIVLHDMPMHVGYEISQEVVDENLEHILDQAENRRHAEKAVMATLLGKGEIL